jgi:lactate permease
MYKQVLDPISHSLGDTSIFAVLPLLTLFILLGGLRMKAQWASLISLGVALVVAIAVYSMPVGQAADSALEGAAFGFFPIMWIVINALWIFHMTEETGHFAVLRRAFTSISGDQRVQVVVIAFCFGALLEALAGFGTPVAICGIMLVGLGFSPIKAAAVALVADTAPVAFGAIAIPITTLAQISGLPKHALSQMVGRQTPLLALVVPFILVGMVGGRRGLRDAWPAALVAGLVFAVLQFATSNYISTELTDIVASLGSAAALVALMRVWSPRAPVDEEPRVAGPVRPAMAGGAALERRVAADEGRPLSTATMFSAFIPYIIVIIVLGVCSLHAVTTELDKATNAFSWPGLHVLNAKGKPPTSLMYKLNWLTAAGTQLLVAGVLTAAALRVAPRLRTHAQATAVADHHRVRRPRAGLRDEPLGPDDHAGDLGGGGGCVLCLPVADHRLVRHGGDGLGHLVEFAVRRASGGCGQAVAPVVGADGGGQQLRRRAGQDGLAAEPGHRRRGGGTGRPGGRHLPKGDRLERPARPGDGGDRAAAVKGRTVLDGALGFSGRMP